LHALLAANWLLDPIVGFLGVVVDQIHRFVPNLGVCLVILALLIRALFWPLNTAQFKAMMAMQKIAPQMKKLQEKYGKSDPQRYQKETMELYKTAGANPLAGCWPMLLQYPVIISVYYMVIAPSMHKPPLPSPYEHTGFLWVGSALADAHIKFFGMDVFGASLAHPDMILVVLYAASMYVSMRFTTMPPSDPAQANQMKIMQIISPLMIGFFAIKYAWPSAMVVYWLAFNVFTMGQQFYLLKKYHQPLSVIDSDHAVTENVPVAAAAPAALKSGNGPATNGSKKKKKGAKR
jgi:YidC/Oxa1 family membrane protein insertase